MKKITKCSELLWVLGTLFVALGVSICSKANLGVSMIAAPAFVIYEAIAPLSTLFSVGMTEYLIQGVLLIVLCVTIKKFRVKYLLTFVVAFIYGYALDLFLWIFANVTFEPIWLKWVMLVVGDVCTGFGVACFFHTGYPLQVYEFFVTTISQRFKINVNKVKWAFDMSLLAVSLIFAFTLFGDLLTFDWSTIWYSSFHSIGLGTIVTTIINSPIISFMSKIIEKIFGNSALFPKFETLLKQEI